MMGYSSTWPATFTRANNVSRAQSCRRESRRARVLEVGAYGKSLYARLQTYGHAAENLKGRWAGGDLVVVKLVTD